MRARSLLAILLVLTAAGCRKPRSDMDKALDKAIEAYGGKQALEAIHCVKQTGRLRALRQGNAVGSLIRGACGSTQLRVEIAYADRPGEIRVLNGERGAREGVEVTGPKLDSMVLHGARMALPQLLVTERPKLVSEGTVDRDGRHFTVVRLPLRGSMALTIEIDQATGLIAKSRGTADGGPEGKLEFVTEYSEYRKVDGVLFPFAETTYAMGTHTGDTVFENIELMDSFPPEVFGL